MDVKKADLMQLVEWAMQTPAGREATWLRKQILERLWSARSVSWAALSEAQRSFVRTLCAR